MTNINMCSWQLAHLIAQFYASYEFVLLRRMDATNIMDTLHTTPLMLTQKHTTVLLLHGMRNERYEFYLDACIVFLL